MGMFGQIFNQDPNFLFLINFLSFFSKLTVSLCEVNVFVALCMIICFLQEVVKTYITYHRLISYSLYLIGMLRFLVSHKHLKFSELLHCCIKKQKVNSGLGKKLEIQLAPRISISLAPSKSYMQFARIDLVDRQLA